MPATRQLAIPIPHEEIAAFCRKWGVRRLAFFGSVTREDFGADSDVDVLVEFRDDATPGLKFYATMPNELSAILGGRPIDLVTEKSLSRWLRPHIVEDIVEEYVEAR